MEMSSGCVEASIDILMEVLTGVLLGFSALETSFLDLISEGTHHG
jgi:hypothetical protein